MNSYQRIGAAMVVFAVIAGFLLMWIKPAVIFVKINLAIMIAGMLVVVIGLFKIPKY